MVDIANVERYYSILLRCIHRTVDLHAVDGHQLLHAVTGEFLLVLLDGIKADSIDIFDGLSQSVGSHIVGCASLELEWQALKSGLLPSHLVNHLAATLIGRQLLQPFFLTIQHADAGWSVHLMSAESKEVAIHRLNIYLEVWRTLGTIHQHGDVVGVGYLDYLLYRIYRSQHVAYVGHANYLGLGGDELLQLIDTQDTIVGNGDVLYHNATFHGL